MLCLGNCSTAYTSTTLPTNSFGGATVFAFWDDLYIFSGTSQGIYYGIQGTSPNRTLIIEYYLSHYTKPTYYYQFQVSFFEALPGVVQIDYFQDTDAGVTCTVGVQSK